MKHNYLSNTSVSDAKNKYYPLLKEAGFACKTENVSVSAACGRILSEAVYAKICSPHYNSSAMDGIAVNAADTFGASEIEPLELTSEKYHVVDTGDPLPEGTNAVVMIEDVVETSDGRVTVLSAVHPWQNVRQVGEDICMGDMIAPSGTVITPALCGAFLAGGVLYVSVIIKPVFGIIPTGDEIVSPKENPKEGEIIEFNSTIFAAMLSEWGAESIVYDIVRDDKGLISDAVRRALAECDAVLILAGSSAGRDDYTSNIISSFGQLVVHGVAAKPGKPAVLGVSGSKPVIGLPGYPVSAIVIMDEFVKDVVDIYYRRQSDNVQIAEAVLSKRIVSSLKYKEYVRVSVGKIGDDFIAVPQARGAGIITSFTKAQGIIEVPQNSEGIEAGERVQVRLLASRESIEKSLVVTGSHDPLIDEIADILRKNGTGIGMISSHVGSMGAITAIKNGQAHLGGIHLLDGETGTYNQTYLKEHFPDGGAVLVKGVGRVQGLMVKKGNPLGIKTFSDIVKHIYVNRQRGAGTRILCDYLLKKNGISPNEVEGHRNEEFTHTAVAALIKAGNADAGLGIYSAAKMYDLDFIPICTEEYDFLVNEQYIDSPLVRAFFDTLSSPEFIKRLEDMGGYTI